MERLAGSAGGDLAKLEAFLGWFLREACGREGPTVAKELYPLRRAIIIMIGTLSGLTDIYLYVFERPTLMLIMTRGRYTEFKGERAVVARARVARLLCV